MDGGIHDEEVFTLGDDEEDEEDNSEESGAVLQLSNLQSGTASEPTSVSGSTTDAAPSPKPEDDASSTNRIDPTSSSIPAKYYIQPGDSLHSISLRYKINVRPPAFPTHYPL